MPEFDPLHKWLGIPRWEQPPNHYRLLGLTLFEADADVIEGAADQRMAHVRTHQVGPHSADSQKLLNGIAAARLCLLTPERKTAYDTELMKKQGSQLVSPENKWPTVEPKVDSPEPIALAPPSRRRRRKYDPEVVEPVADNDLRSLGLLVLVSAGIVVLVFVIRDNFWPPRQQVKPAAESKPEFFDEEKESASVDSVAASEVKQSEPESSIPSDDVPDFFEMDEEKPAADDFFTPDEPTKGDDAPDFFRDE